MSNWNEGELSDVTIAMSAFFKQRPVTATSPATQIVRQRLESMDSGNDSPIKKLFDRHERAEKNRSNILESRVRALSEADELRLEKVEAIKEAREKRAERIQNSQTRAMINRKRLLSQKSDKLRRRHTLIESQLWGRKEEEQEARTQLSVVFERREHAMERKRKERLENVARRARNWNRKVAEAKEKARLEEAQKKEELREHWEEKIERAREKRQQLLQQKVSGM